MNIRNDGSNAMEVEILLFAGIKDRLRRDSIAISLSPASTVRDLLEAIARAHPEVADQLTVCRVAVAEEFVGPERELTPGEEIALIPPVSGGHDGDRVRLSPDPLLLSDAVAAVEHRGAGGIATFTGNVRAHSRGKDIEYLDYEAYDKMALRVMIDIATSIESRVEGTRVAIHHRVGRLHVGDTAVIIAASAPHRSEAFQACRAAIESLKKDVPIWKREVATDGEAWIGQGP